MLQIAAVCDEIQRGQDADSKCQANLTDGEENTETDSWQNEKLNGKMGKMTVMVIRGALFLCTCQTALKISSAALGLIHLDKV